MARGKITSFNMDNTLCKGEQQDDLVEIIENVSPAIIVVQEANEIKLKNLIPGTYKTSQVLDREGTKDAAVVWKDSLFNHIKTETAHILRVGSGGTEQHARYACITTLENKSSKRRTRVVAVSYPSRPPRALTIMQSTMTKNLVPVLNDKRTANFIVGGDFNYSINEDPYRLATRTNLGKAFIGRIGFYLTDSMLPTTIVEETSWRQESDHVPVTLEIEI